MKPLVPAANAQFGVGAGWKARTPRACGFRAFPNGMGRATLLPWRPVLVHGRTPFAVTDLCTTQGRNLYCGATRPRAVNAVCRCSLPCVGMADRRTPRASPAREALLLLFETMAAKEARKRFDCGGKHLGCRHWADRGLQCGLSGSRAARWATPRRHAERETA